MYAVSFRRSAEKDLRRLDVTVRRRVLRAVDLLAHDPRPPGCRKLEGSEDAFRIRVGDWRVIYTIDDSVMWSPSNTCGIAATLTAEGSAASLRQPRNMFKD